MPERPGLGDLSPKRNRKQSLAAGEIHSNQLHEGERTGVEPARYKNMEKPKVVPAKPKVVEKEKPKEVWTPPSEDKKEAPAGQPVVQKEVKKKIPKKKKKKSPFSKTYDVPLSKPHAALVSKSRPRVENSSVPSHMVEQVLGARVNVVAVNEVKGTCKVYIGGEEVWIPMSAIMWLDRNWKDSMVEQEEEESEEEYEPEEANEDHKSFHASLYERFGIVDTPETPPVKETSPVKERPPVEVLPDVVEDDERSAERVEAALPRRQPEESKTKAEPEPERKLPLKARFSDAAIELAVLDQSVQEEEELIEKEKPELPPPAVTTNDMIIDCCCCRSHGVRRARVEFWNHKSPEELRTALQKMGIRESIQDFAENEAVRQGLRSSAYFYRNMAELVMVGAIVCLFVSASQFVSGTTSNGYAIAGGILCACALAFYHLAGLRQNEHENRTEEVNEYIAKYKLKLEPHTILGRLEDEVRDLSLLDKKSLLGMAARSQRFF